ncbi:glutathione S-transferase [Duganella sp. FT109W]|uniref:Glutathione S-transferase n=1 Tax=Duganella margarita TaxID=2692170 RepID=A0A7X4KI95_9BURK|nr:glutathione S-transferase [Duganella margarita]MYM74275.1 glutathione S-transferase [Duganella margarita]MYN42169.1 glutathione S-transferase [Duganella margarita]
MKLYGIPLSGHTHRAQLFLGVLNLPHEFVSVNLGAGEHKQQPFLSLNAFGEIPVLQDGDVTLADSNAILVYLASKYDDTGRWLPRDPLAAANVQRWLSAAAGKIAYGPATARLVTVFNAPRDHDAAKDIAVRLFDVMEQELHGRRWLVGEHASVADIAAFSYVAHAPEGGVSLKPYPNIRAWLDNVRALPGFVAMPATKAGLAPEEV